MDGLLETVFEKDNLDRFIIGSLLFRSALAGRWAEPRKKGLVNGGRNARAAGGR